MRKLFITISICGTIALLLASCHKDTMAQPNDAIVEVRGAYLCRQQVNQVTQGLDSDDSAKLAQMYIQQWIEDQLVLHEAESNDPEIEQQVAQYRQQLYVLRYQQRLLEDMSQEVSDSLIQAEYASNPKSFVLDETILHGILLVIPKQVNIPPRLSTWMQKPTAENLEKIEAFAYQHAKGYELFLDAWYPLNSIALHLPMNSKELTASLRSGVQQLRMEDSTSTYLLQITEKHLLGDKMPIDYAHDKIVEMALHDRQIEIIQNERQRLYNEALRKKKIKFITDENQK